MFWHSGLDMLEFVRWWLHIRIVWSLYTYLPPIHVRRRCHGWHTRTRCIYCMRCIADVCITGYTRHAIATATYSNAYSN